MNVQTADDAAAQTLKDQEKEAKRQRLHTRINKAAKYLDVAGLGWVTPLLKMMAGEDPRAQSKELWRLLGMPILAIGLFLMLWANLAPRVHTSLGDIPGPAQVWAQTLNLYDDYVQQRQKEAAFYQRQEVRNAAKLVENPQAKVKIHKYTGKPTYLDQIVTSLKTVFMGFLIGSVIAIPVGIFCGLSPLVTAGLNPLIQIFKPVSPLAWLPIVTMGVSALYVSENPMFEKAFVTSAITVTLCSLWPTLINTAIGVASIDKDLMNVGRVLRLKWDTTLTKLILPSSLPYIFAGLRSSLGVGWMVLIAAEMLAQNPGLGKFIWDEFQNGSSQSLAKIMVAVFTIGIIGFALDRVMSALQTLFTYGDVR